MGVVGFHMPSRLEGLLLCKDPLRYTLGWTPKMEPLTEDNKTLKKSKSCLPSHVQSLLYWS